MCMECVHVAMAATSAVAVSATLRTRRAPAADYLGRVFRLGTGDGTWTVGGVSGPTRWHTIVLRWNHDSVRKPADLRLKIPVRVFRDALEYGLIEEI